MTTDVVKQIRRATRRRFTAEEKIRIVLEGLRGEIPVTELCRKEGIQPSIYYKWSKAFLDSGKNGLTRETRRDATTDEVRRLKEENEALKELLSKVVDGASGGDLILPDSVDEFHIFNDLSQAAVAL